MKLTKNTSKGKYPEKTSLNILIQDKNSVENPKVQIGIFVVFVILLLIFAKFMVIDRLVDARNAEIAYHQMEDDIATLQESNEEYSEVLSEYSHYGNGYLNDEEKIEIDRMTALEIIDECILPTANVENVNLAMNVATVTVNQVTLKEVSAIVDKLENRKNVDYVTVSTAGREQSSSSEVSADLTINFVNTGGEE